MKAKILDITGKETETIDLPKQFSEPLNKNLIKRAVIILQSNARQQYGSFPMAGMRSSAKLSRRRGNYKGAYNHGMSRVPRKTLWKRGTQFGWVGAFMPGAVGGRKAHPPQLDKDFTRKINKKENRKAIRSAISATLNPELVKQHHRVSIALPLILESKFESLNKTKQVKEVLEKIGLKDELSRISERKVRAGKGKSRGRKYKIKTGPLIVTAKSCSLEKASRNMQGIQIVPVNSLNAELLAPGTAPGRLVIWTKNAIERMKSEELFK